MLNHIKDWLEKRRAAAREAEYRRGYDWAAGRLLRGHATPITIEAYTYIRYSPRYDDFDRGADAAVDRLVEAGVIEDDRVWP